MNKTKKIISIIMLVVLLGITFLATNTFAATRLAGDTNIKKGDMNGDNRVNVTDLAILNAYFAGKRTLSDEIKERADVDGNGKLTKEDATLLSLKVKSQKLFPSETKKGDINLDGIVNLKDFSILLVYLKSQKPFKYEFYRNQADLNGDGKVNVTDLVKLRVLTY
ncbi:MAG: dockerin type I repeat-containing protein [Clostridia bacterium]|nr:dockerin type I repeat-containing protein [Clostridia bacterium]